MGAKASVEQIVLPLHARARSNSKRFEEIIANLRERVWGPLPVVE